MENSTVLEYSSAYVVCFFSMRRSVLSPDLSSCSIEQKSALYIIANSSFSNQRNSSTTFYHLIRPYLGKTNIHLHRNKWTLGVVL